MINFSFYVIVKKKKKKKVLRKNLGPWGKMTSLKKCWCHHIFFAPTCSLSVGAHLWQVSRQKHKKWRSYVGGAESAPPRYWGAPKRPSRNRVKKYIWKHCIRILNYTQLCKILISVHNGINVHPGILPKS